MEDKHQQNPQAEEIIINRDTIIIPSFGTAESG